MIKRLKIVFAEKSILKNLVIKNLKERYSGSVLEITWAVITPLLLVIVLDFVFTSIMKVEIKDFSLFVLSGILPWFFFNRALNEATYSFLSHSHLLKQFNIPREFIPFACILSNLVSFLLGLMVVIPIFVISNLQVIRFLIFLPLLIFFHFLFTLGLALIFSVTNVFYRDLSHFLEIAFLFWFWLTPVFYSLDMIPSRFRVLFFLNPLTPYILIYRDILFEAKLPELGLIAMAISLSLFFLFLGYSLLVRLEPSITKRI